MIHKKKCTFCGITTTYDDKKKPNLHMGLFRNECHICGRNLIEVI